MITFFAYPSPSSLKVAIMLEESGLGYRPRKVDLHAGGADDTAFRSASPAGTVPAIADAESGATLFESSAILLYLAERSGRLLPREPALRGEVLAWVAFESANVSAAASELYHYEVAAPEPLPYALNRYKERLRRFSALVNERLVDREHVCGDYSIADIALFPWMELVADLADVDARAVPHLGRWIGRIAARRTVVRARQEGMG